jgi:hypothetical protein
LGERNKILLRRKFSRSQLLAYTANLPSSLIGLEACAGSHFLGTVLREQGHQVRLIPAQFVKPYRKTNKNDFIRADHHRVPGERFSPLKGRIHLRGLSFAQLQTSCSSVADHTFECNRAAHYRWN